ncbi:hypothetical protein [Pseudobacteriovorax antillogorgiicola]|uniref:Uncharacterized protein n=1 Tax=Pseudobacteriovorax antillogorgiicola TaxID=1513793 RepID=A0A1Y6CCR5_9BACT|nr:hypothetical protein [Pseudobacteriovorax antillogorgiicola]TCS48341.1 hypothetical protein EDD56_118121 [Pseudobacteriovorax antillogorgiicola]SMF56366.1 hypothetical protein SAMN06296036_11820 [Pseudobacteriovorax antillogorgiicola]
MSEVYEIDHHRLSELYDLLHHHDLTFVKHATYQMFHLFGSPLHNFWTNENQAFGVYLCYFKLARKLAKAEFIAAIQKGHVPDEGIFSEDEKLLVLNEHHLRHQALRVREFLMDLAEEFDYEIWLIESGVQIPFVH